MQISVGDLVFDVTAIGSGSPVLLLHGFPQTSHCWRLLVPHLSSYRVVLFDQRGYSPRARPLDVEDYRVPRMVEDALGVLDALGIEQAHVVGHDFGAAVAWQLGARHASRVLTLSVLSVPHPGAMIEALRNDPDQRGRSQYMRTFARPGYDEELLADGAQQLRAFFSDAVDVEQVVTAAREPGALAAWLKWYPGQRLADLGDTPAVTVPTLHVWSDGDAALGPAATMATREWVTGTYRLEVLEGVSHWIPEEAADRVAPLLLEHLATVEG
ncbi:MAG TPA: alpha/beta hydrolase [Mycobacteriales bacterium]|nr:alpha/beta hydrolase [Mycobacteriales bacterium]